jgi:hypothetical protein
MQKNFLPQFIAPCGMNCGICVAFFGYTLTGKKRKQTCNTCRSRKSKCAFIKQQCNKLASKQIEYCFECAIFPCEHLKKLDERYRNNYRMSMIENLNYIKSNGVNQFLKREQDRWKCPNCGGTVCVHNRKCYSCSP